jgi:solute carrier family 25 S-adenosylmethionine transporter 26
MKGKGVAGFYTGYMTTVAREIPFVFIQFPLYEGLKKHW